MTGWSVVNDENGAYKSLCDSCYKALPETAACSDCSERFVGTRGSSPHPRRLLDDHVRQKHPNRIVTCPRRMGEFGPWEHEGGLDVWVNDCCSFCGSVSPQKFFELRGRAPLRLRAPCAKTVGKSAEYAVASSLSRYFYMNLPGTLGWPEFAW